MNYLKIIENWNDEKWKNFGKEFLQNLGWEYDFNSDFDVFAIKNQRFLASFQNNLNQGAIGIEKEINILSRINIAKADGFIGFFSGNYTTSLDERLKKLNIPYLLTNGIDISVLLPFFDSIFIDKFFSDRQEKSILLYHYHLNKNQNAYSPLYCSCGCQNDILKDALSISTSAAYLYRKGNRIEFIYGFKNCIFKTKDNNTSCGWTEINQILHPDQFRIWNEMLRNYIKDNPEVDLSDYHRPKRLFLTKILQRIRPINSGFFLEAMDFE